ncbi:MAG: hypothetical protein ACRCWR_07610 [Saezia sp.]
MNVKYGAKNALANSWLEHSFPYSIEVLRDFLLLDRKEITGDEYKERLAKRVKIGKI